MEDDGEPPSAAAFVSLGTGVLALLGSLCCCVPILQWLSILATPLLLAVGIGSGIAAVRTPGRKTIAVLGLVLNGVALLLFGIQLLAYAGVFAALIAGELG